MLVKIFGTVFSKTFASVVNFLIVIITAKYLGAAARGEIALVVLSVSIVALFQSIIGGSALTFFASNHALKRLLTIAIGWSMVVGTTVSLVLAGSGLIPSNVSLEVLLISLPQGLVLIFQSILIGRQQILAYNGLEFLRSATLASLVFLVVMGFEQYDLSWVYTGYVAANSITAIAGVYFMTRLPKVASEVTLFPLSKKLFRFGFQVQLNNISQIFNYRFVYFVIEQTKGLEVLGIFSVGISIAETIWIISKSISTYQTSLLVNTTDRSKQATSTVSFAKMSIFFTAVAVIVLLIIPEAFFAWLFGEQFSVIKMVNVYFAPAILFLAFFGIINHYFYSTNRNDINIYASLLGNLLTLISALLLIPSFGLFGAAGTYSIAYFGMLIFMSFAFRSVSGLSFTAFCPKKDDFSRFLKLLNKHKYTP